MYIIRALVKKLTTVHINRGVKNVVIFSTPRTGSTWLMEIITKHSSAKRINEPLDLRENLNKKYSGLGEWEDVNDLNRLNSISDYLNRLISGNLSFKNSPPFSRDYKFICDHSVLKILHGCENMTNEICHRIDASYIFLTRHPIPFALSSKQAPRLKALIKSNFVGFNKNKLELVQRISEEGSIFDRALIEWGYQNFYLEQHLQSDCVFISYEEMVYQPSRIVNELIKKNIIDSEAGILEAMNRPSKSTVQSNMDRKSLLNSTGDKKMSLISSWKSKVSDEQVQKAQEMLDLFGINYYSANEIMPRGEQYS